MCWRIIMTVGTSLVDNTGGRSADLALNTASQTLREQAERNPDNLERNRPGVLQKLKALKVSDEIGYRLRANNFTDRLPQELSYLYLLLTNHIPDATNIEVKLLASDSPLGQACAQIIRDFLMNGNVRGRDTEPWGRITNVCLRTIGGLQTEDHDRFCREGAPNLITTIRDLAQDAPAGSGVIINPTGGFKELLPYATIATAFIQREFELHYLFADSDKIAVLPPYPIGLDFPLWHSQEALRRAAAHYQRYAEKLDFRMRSVVQSPTGGDRATEIFTKAYEEQTQRDHFQPLSKRVVERLLDRGEYRDRLCTLIDTIGPHIWLGDKIPLMAGEHASKHHQSLFETAQLLLTPMLEAKPGFLSQEERFVLLAGVLLHDCGHSMEALPDKDKRILVRLFPTEVRDLHHYLTFHRLTTREHAAAIGWEPEGDLSNEVAWLCLYHRHHTGWDSVRNDFGRGYCPYLEMQIECPTCAKVTTNVDLPKLIVLLRLIDGCDNQTRRVGPPARTEVLQRLLEQEKLVYIRQLEEAVDAALAYADSTPLPGVDFVRNCQKWLDTPPEQRGKPPRFDRGIRQQLALPNGDPVWARLWTAVARAADEITMRDRQLFHFVKHQVVRRVLIYPDHINDNWSFAITLEEDHEFEVEGYGKPLDSKEFAKAFASDLDHADGYQPTLRQWLLAELAKEVGYSPDTATSGQIDYLAKCAGQRVQFTFQWKDGTDRIVLTGQPNGETTGGERS